MPPSAITSPSSSAPPPQPRPHGSHQSYPQTLRTKEDGRKDEHGNRQQFDWSDPKYRSLAHLMAEKMAERFGHDPNVIAWQIDNEYSEESFGPPTRAQFQQWLQAKYKTLDNLNARWTTAYWSETYQAWDQIPVEEKYGNPGLLLNWKQFVSDTWRSYQKNQLDAIRPHADPRQIITTNMMGLFDAYDHYTVSHDLDFASWDDYVGTGHLDPVRNGAIHDLTRGFLRKNFWVMETQPGAVNWSPNNNALNKGEVRAMAWNAIGHGSEAVEYWQWRSALNGQEQYHGVLVGADGLPVPLYAEVQQIGVDFEKAAPLLAGTTPQSDVAILQDYNSRWAINWQRHNRDFDPVTSLLSFYKPLHTLVHTLDIVSDTAPLTRYKLVVAPALNLLTPAAIANLEAYVKAGGHLVLGQRSAMKDQDNTLFPQRQPGPLADLLGAKVEQYYALDAPVPVSGSWGSADTKIWAEQLTVLSPETKTLMTYGPSNGFLDNQPAAVTRKLGRGSITYIGAALDEPTMLQATKWMLSESGLQPTFPSLPEGVDLAIRSSATGSTAKPVYILTNYAPTPPTHHPPPTHDRRSHRHHLLHRHPPPLATPSPSSTNPLLSFRAQRGTCGCSCRRRSASPCVCRPVVALPFSLPPGPNPLYGGDAPPIGAPHVLLPHQGPRPLRPPHHPRQAQRPRRPHPRRPRRRPILHPRRPAP